ncbi:MAG: ribonuclease R [Desulfuromonadaceae bacterium]
MEILGIDIGFGFTKATNGTDVLIFKSVFGEATEVQFRELILADDDQDEHLQINIDGREYFLGELAERQSNVRFFTLDQGQFIAKFVKVLALTAAAKMVGGHIPINLVTGLPIGYYQKYKKEVSSLLLGEHSVVLSDAAGQSKSKVININKIRVIPQPFGSMFNLMLNDLGELGDKRLVKEKIGIIDVGFRTSDYTISDKMRYSERGSRTTDSGIARAFNVIATKLREESGVNIELYRLYDAVDRGSIKIRGKEYNLKNLIEEVFSQLAATVANEVDRLWADDWDIDTMVITGGGGSVLAGYLQPLLKGHVMPLDGGRDARLNNVLGYRKFGKHLWARDAGTLIRHKRSRFSLPRQVVLKVGPIRIHRDGYGFVSLAPDAEDLFVPARYLGDVMDGDVVAVRMGRDPRSGKPEGRLERIVERSHRQFLGRYEMGRDWGYVVSLDPDVRHDIVIPHPPAGLRPGQMVLVRIDLFPMPGRHPEGTVLEILGDADDPAVEILAVAHKYHFPHRFAAEVLVAAGQVPDQVRVEDWAGREDLRSLPLVTIDGETARDFDDAVCVRREADGCFRLWVAIADVGHYVAENSLIDKAAYERSTSIYFPGQCIPMLPEALSNGICSLNPAVERLALTAELLFDAGGKLLAKRFYPAVMCSRARLTYTDVRAMLELGDSAVIHRYASLLPVLQEMEVLARLLLQGRRQRGSLDFDLPEAEVELGEDGKPVAVRRAERFMAHRMIEEFMLAANEAVAAFLTERGVPLLYRIHELPDQEKIESFQFFAAQFGYGFELGSKGGLALALQRLLVEVQGRPEEKLLNSVLLRSLKQARYAAENLGHFGLAAPVYCHFTSPIRRYPDLIIHRILREQLVSESLAPARIEQLRHWLPQAGEHTSQCERRAMEAERNIVELKKCQYMATRIGEVYDGLVSGVQPFGFFVELNEIFVEGLIHLSSLTDDYYRFEEDMQRLIGERRRRIFQVGMPVRVRLEHVDLIRREIDFSLIAADSLPSLPGARSKSKRRLKP